MKLKKIILVLLSLCIVSNFIFAQTGSISSNPENEIVLTQNDQQDNPESRFVISENSTSNQNSRRTGGAWSFIKMILVLALVVVIIYLLMNFFKKTVNGPETDDPYLRKVAQINLGPGKSVQIVTILEKGYVLGVSDSGVTLISELDDKELINAMNLTADKKAATSKARNFTEVLEMFLPSKSSRETSATQTNIYSDSSKAVSDFIKTQRKRINKKEE